MLRVWVFLLGISLRLKSEAFRSRKMFSKGKECYLGGVLLEAGRDWISSLVISLYWGLVVYIDLWEAEALGSEGSQTHLFCMWHWNPAWRTKWSLSSKRLIILINQYWHNMQLCTWTMIWLTLGTSISLGLKQWKDEWGLLLLGISKLTFDLDKGGRDRWRWSVFPGSKLLKIK